MQLNKAKIRYPDLDVEEKAALKKTRISLYSEDYKGEFYFIELTKLIPFKNQAREIFDEEGLKNLSDSIKAHGVRQPLTIVASEQKEGFFEIVSGERRFRAAKLAGLEKVPCIIMQDLKKAEEIAIIENIQREDLHPIELKNAYKNLLAIKVCNSFQDIANKVCVSKASVVDILALDKLPDQTQSYLLNNKIKSRKLFRRLLKSPESEHINVIQQYSLEGRKVPDKQFHYTQSALLSRKTKVLTVSVFGDQLLVEKNKINNLSEEQKAQFKNLLHEIGLL